MQYAIVIIQQTLIVKYLKLQQHRTSLVSKPQQKRVICLNTSKISKSSLKN